MKSGNISIKLLDYSISEDFTFYALPCSAIKFQGFKEAFVLCLSPPLPLLCYCVRLSYLYRTVIKSPFFTTRQQAHHRITHLYHHFLTRGIHLHLQIQEKETEIEGKLFNSCSLGHLELRSSINKRAPPSISPTKRWT